MSTKQRQAPASDGAGSTGAATGARDDTLVRVLTVGTLVMTSCGTMIGTGTYTLIGDMAGETGYATVVAFAFGFLPALLVGLVYAALSTRFPRASSLSHWLDMSLGKSWRGLSFIGGSATACLYLCAGTSTLKGSMATVANKMLELNVDNDGWVVHSMCIATLVFCLALCLYGLEEASSVLAFCTVVEIGGLLLLIGLVALSGHGSEVFNIDWTALPASKGVGDAAPTGLTWLLHVIAGGVFVVFVFGGFETVASQAQDTVNPRRDMPRALSLSLIIVALLNVFTLVACLCVHTPEELASSSDPLTDVVGKVAPTLPRWVFDFILLFSGFNSIIGVQIHVSRTLWGMAREGKLPAVVSTVHTFHNKPQPHVALALTAFLQGVMLFVFDRANLGRACAVLLSVSFILAHAAFFFIKLQERRGARTVDANAWDVPVWVPVFGGVATIAILLVALHHWNSTGVLLAWTALALTTWRLNEVGFAGFFSASSTATDAGADVDAAAFDKGSSNAAVPPRVEGGCFANTSNTAAATQGCAHNDNSSNSSFSGAQETCASRGTVNVVAASDDERAAPSVEDLDHNVARRRIGATAARTSGAL